MNNGPRGFRTVEKAKDFKTTIKKLFSSLKEYRLSLIIIFVFAILSTIFSIIGPKILGTATTEIFEGIISKISGGAGINFTKISHTLLLLIGLYIISAIFSYIQGFIMSGITQKYTYKLRSELSEKIHRLPINYFDKKPHGEVLSTVTNDIDTLGQSLNQAAAQIITSIVTIIGVLVMMFSINVVITLISIIILPLSFIMIGFVMKKSQNNFKYQQEYLAKVNGQIEEMLGSQMIIKAFNAEDKMLKRFKKENTKLSEYGWKSQFLSGLMQPIMGFIGNFGYVMVALIGGYYTVLGKMSVGDIQSLITYTRNLTQPIAQIAQISNMIQSAIASAERVFEFLGTEEESQKKSYELSLNNVIGNVEFKNVKFGYDKDNIIIKDFNAKVKSGQKIAIVGPTGAGKTTIVKLLMRFYDINSGSILVDGNNINEVDRRNLRKSFGMVLQDTWLFNGTIMDNLRYGKLDATDEEVIEAAKTAYVHHFIQTLPESYNMEINEESNNISQGQKQLLTIARAILANPKILILDEATSSVDTRTEILIQKAMDELMKNRTSFIIAHRLSTIRNADLILVMKDGDIVEQGTHNELIKKEGFYANLYNSQFEKVS